MAPQAQRPLGTYTALTVLFNVAAWALASRRRDRPPIPTGDLVLLGVATQHITRTVAKDRVTQTIRKPFVERDAEGGEHPKRSGPRRALGELLTCQFCLAPWVGLGLYALHTAVPGATRAFASVMTIASISDVLNRGMLKLQDE